MRAHKLVQFVKFEPKRLELPKIELEFGEVDYTISVQFLGMLILESRNFQHIAGWMHVVLV
jgi:hypothetical protein